jgi:hypothetical protein
MPTPTFKLDAALVPRGIQIGEQAACVDTRPRLGKPRTSALSSIRKNAILNIDDLTGLLRNLVSSFFITAPALEPGAESGSISRSHFFASQADEQKRITWDQMR